jgi:hypothetical protein
MAQIIKHRRGSISQLKDVTAKVGELVMATGSISDLNGPFIFIGETENAAGGYRAVSKLYSGNAAPTISNVAYGTVLDGTPFYAAGNETLYILSSGGNTALDLTGNIEGNTISGVTINNLQSTNVTASFFTGSFVGDGTNLFNIPASGVTGLNLSRIATGAYTASISDLGGFQVNTDTSITGALNVDGSLVVTGSQYVDNVVSRTGNQINALHLNGGTFNAPDVELTSAGDISLFAEGGTVNVTGSMRVTGDIIFSGSINLGDYTGDTINFNGEVSSSILPQTGSSFDLGSSGQTWNNVWAENAHFTNISLNSIAFDGLTEGRFVKDIPENCKLACELFYNHLDKNVDPIDYYLESRNFSIPNLTFPTYDDHLMEYGFNIIHGHSGNNGARGSLKSFDKCYEKSISGHSHFPAIFRDSVKVGTLSLLKQGYNEKGGSSWMHTNALIYPNGTFQLIHVIEGEWKLKRK